MVTTLLLSLLVGAVGAVALLWKFRGLFRFQKPQSGCAAWGYVAIPVGEKWSLCTTNGSVQCLAGPKVLLCWGDRLTRLRRVCASSSEYLRVQYVDGKSEIIAGPAMTFVDPLVHQEVLVRQAVSLSDHELLVVYREEDREGERSVQRHIIRGPCLHVPVNASEWTLEFCWHGCASDHPDKVGRKVKGALRFSKLRTCPDQSYIDIEGVRTRDDAAVTVKVMFFFRLASVELMLQETHDPIADFMNALSSDVIEFVGSKTFEEFKSSTDKLNSLDTYSQLVSRSQGIGYEVTKVVFRGYGAPSQLQRMHDDAIERRTKLILDRESSEQEQSLQDMKLQREESRNKLRRQMEADAKRHELEMQRAVQAHSLDMERLGHEADVEAQRAKDEAAVDMQKERTVAELEHLDRLQKELGLSPEHLATYLTSKIQGAPEKLVQITGKCESHSEASSLVHVDS